MKKSKDEGKSSRQEFRSWFEFFFSVNNLCIGLSNFLVFPGKVHEYRGGAFILAYILMLIAIGYPVLYLELIIGQFHRCSPVLFIRRCVPILQGFGYLALVSAITVLYPYQYMVARAFKFAVSLAITRSQKMPWSTCDNSWNTEECYEFYNEKCPDLKKGHIRYRNQCVNETSVQGGFLESAEDQYLHHVVHRIGPTHLSFSNFDHGVAYSIFILWLSIAFVQIRVGRGTTSLIYVPTIFVFLICPFLLFRALHLDGAINGVGEMITIEWAELLYSKIWMDALSLVVQSLSIGIGGHSIMSSFASNEKSAFQVATLAVLADTGLSLIITGTLYSILGFISFTTGKRSVYEIKVIPETLLTHSTVPVLLRKVAHNAWLWVFLYYISLVIVGWKSCSLVLKTISVTLADIFQFSSNNLSFDVFSIFVSIVLSFFGLLLCFENIASGLFITALLLIVLDVYGLDLIYEDIYELMGRPSINQWSGAYSWSTWKWRWRMAPAFSFIYVVNVFNRDYPSHENDLVFYYFYDFLQSFFIFLVLSEPFVFAFYAYAKVFYHINSIEKTKSFKFKTLWQPQRFLRSWNRIRNTMTIEQKLFSDTHLPEQEPEDPNEFWRNKYLSLYESIDIKPEPIEETPKKPLVNHWKHIDLDDDRLTFENYIEKLEPERNSKEQLQLL